MFMKETHLTADDMKDLVRDRPPVEVQFNNRKGRRAEAARVRREGNRD